MKPTYFDHETWLDLSRAAEYLGVHYTTLRRWADAGEIAFIRTPGGRRRFSARVLAEFVQGLAQVQTSTAEILPADLPAADPLPVKYRPLQTLAINNARASVRSLSISEGWLGKLSPEQRLSMKGTGDRLMGLLLQYNSRSEGGETFLEEGKRITGEYSQVCSQIGMSLQETVHVFLFFRRSMLEAIYQTGYLGGNQDFEGQRLYMRTTDFLDVLMISLIDRYLQTNHSATE